MATSDIDRDGDMDIVIGNAGQKNVIYFNENKGTKFRSITFGQTARTYCVEVGDLNADKFPDIVAGNSGSHNFIYLNKGKQDQTAGVLPAQAIVLKQ